MSGSGKPPPTLVVFDCETQDKIANMPGVDRTDQVSALEVSCLSYQILQSTEIAASPERAAAEATSLPERRYLARKARGLGGSQRT